MFRAKLYALTNVPPENQKVMLRGGATLKDDWAPFVGKIKTGQQIMLMGNASENVRVVSSTPTVEFMEETNDNEPVYEGPPGLENLGNTCYANASLQCLNAITELKDSFSKIDSSQPNNRELKLLFSMKQVLEQMKSSKKAILPAEFLITFRSLYPQFAEIKNGKYTQQDAEECWSQLVTSLRGLPRLDSVPGSNPVEQLFEIQLLDEYSCTENPAEEKKITPTSATKLQCHINNDKGKIPVTQILEGIELSMHEQIEKMSPSLGKNTLYDKKSSISKLPYYLTVQFVRFFWKKTAEKKTKITKPIDFPMVLDLYKYCTPDLQAKLAPNRAPGAAPPTDKTLANNTGRYDLYAVITHQGVYADGGHYVAWVRQSEDPNDWVLFDDKEVSRKTEEDIRKLNGSGGAQWHIAYLCLYKAKN
uniref:Ubiquitin carboxyl-terminal hydrolase n=1 Tax=Arcella intermedia TaxID=1963864 RepID=A0A6B2L454_9EUKA